MNALDRPVPKMTMTREESEPQQLAYQYTRAAWRRSVGPRPPDAQARYAVVSAGRVRTAQEFSLVPLS